jgi:serine protease Do
MASAYLGLGVESLHPALSSQLRDVLPNGQGVLVADVQPNSPAAQAGLKQFDILVKIDDQKLYSPEQLIKLVHDMKPGTDEPVTYVRGGKEATTHVKLGESHGPQAHTGSPMAGWTDQQFSPGRQSMTDDGAGWEAFDAIRIAKLGEHKWRAEVDFRTKDGKVEHKKYEGSRDEIRQAIRGEKDVTPVERAQLLRSLNLEQTGFDWMMPFERFAPMAGTYSDQSR